MCATCGDGNRTQYLMNISLVLCQLSYRPVHMVEAYTDIEKSLYINKKILYNNANSKYTQTNWDYLVFLGITQFAYNSYAQGTRSSELFINNYWLVAHFMALLLTYHHRFPSPAPFFESQVAPSKSGFSWRMESGIVPVSPTGTRASLPRIEEMGTTYRTRDCMRRS